MAFTRFGEYHGDTVAPTRHENLIHLPNNSGVYQPWLVWGYDYWPSPEAPAEPCPTGGVWRTTKDLRAEHGIPPEATAVRIHIKAKTFAGPNPVAAVQTACQISGRPHGSTTTPNEFQHCCLGKASNAQGQNDYDLGHVEVDLLLNDSGKLDFWLYPAIADSSYAQIAVIFYIAGYWA